MSIDRGLGVGVAMVVGLSSCSFITAATQGRSSVRGVHEGVDVVAMALTGTGCALAAIAWGSTDSWAPKQDDPSSWTSPQDRQDVYDTGRRWSPWACTAAVAFMASAIYGNAVKPPVDDDATSSGGWGAALGAAAAVTSGALRARQPIAPTVQPSPQPFVWRQPRQPTQSGCSSDFDCGTGEACVKGHYELSGTCARTVDRTGTPVFTAPSPSSVGPNLPDSAECGNAGDCPVGFYCASGGQCLSNP